MGSSISFKKRTNKFDFTSMIPQIDLFLFVFWRKSTTPKNHFEINWPLAYTLTAKSWHNLREYFYFDPIFKKFKSKWTVYFKLKLEKKNSVHLLKWDDVENTYWGSDTFNATNCVQKNINSNVTLQFHQIFPKLSIFLTIFHWRRIMNIKIWKSFDPIAPYIR